MTNIQKQLEKTFKLLVSDSSVGTKVYGKDSWTWTTREFASPREIFEAQMRGEALAANCGQCRKTNDFFINTPFIFFDIDGSSRGIDFRELRLSGFALSIVPSNFHGKIKEGYVDTNYFHVLLLFFFFLRPLTLAEVCANYRVYKPLFNGEHDVVVKHSYATQTCGDACRRQET